MVLLSNLLLKRTGLSVQGQITLPFSLNSIYQVDIQNEEALLLLA